MSYKGKKTYTILFRTEEELNAFCALCFLKGKTQRDVVMEWVKRDMENKPDLAELVQDVLWERGTVENG